MANIKQTILRKKVGDIVYELYVKTGANMVYLDDTTTLDTKLDTMLTDISKAKDQLATLIGDGEAGSITSKIEAAVNALKDESNPESLGGKIKALKEAVDAINNEATGILAQSKSYTDTEIGKAKEELKGLISGAWHFKGVVDYVEDLPTEDVGEGDVYQVKYRGTKEAGGTDPLNAEYGYNGTEFVELGSTVDLSSYSTTEQMNSAINTAASNAQSNAEATAANALNEYKTANDAVVEKKARFILSTTEPEGLTEYDIWAQELTEAAE